MAYTLTAHTTGGTTGLVICQFAEWSGVTASSFSATGGNVSGGGSTSFNTGASTSTSAQLNTSGLVSSSVSGWTPPYGTQLTQSFNGDNTAFTTTAFGPASTNWLKTSFALTTGIGAVFSKSAGTFTTLSQQKVAAAGATTSVTVTPTSTPTAGDFTLAYVYASAFSTPPTGMSVTDSGGAIWVQVAFINGGATTQQSVGIFCVLAYATGGSNTNQLMMMGVGT